MIQQFPIEFVQKRCPICHIYWYIEMQHNFALCPNCSHVTVAKLRIENAGLINSNKGLRGAIKRMKRERAKR